jgi:hypothetical protein
VTVFPMSTEGVPRSPVDRLADLIDALDDHVRAADTTVRRSESNRIGILYVHGLFAVAIGPAFASIGTHGMNGPIWRAMRALPGTPYSLGLIMFLGGVILTVATTFRNRPWEIVGLILLVIWYGTVAVTFGASIALWFASGRQGMQPGFYAPLVYLHFLAVMLVHCRTLRKMIRSDAGRE